MLFLVEDLLELWSLHFNALTCESSCPYKDLPLGGEGEGEGCMSTKGFHIRSMGCERRLDKGCL